VDGSDAAAARVGDRLGARMAESDRIGRDIAITIIKRALKATMVSLREGVYTAR
jgi:hypothetical protein